MKKKSLFYSQAIISVGVNVANALNISFMLLVMRLPAAAFAEITSILAITFLFSVSQSSARNQFLLFHKETGDVGESISRTIRALLPIGFSEGIALVVFSGKVSDFLRFDSALPFIIVAACGCTYVLNGLMQGIFASQQKHSKHALSIILESSGRLPLALLFLKNGYQTTDTAWIILIASICALCINLWMLGKQSIWKIIRGKFGPMEKADVSTALLIIASTLFIGIALKMDILWSKHILDAEHAGAYGMMSFIASVLFLNSSGISRASLSFVRRRGFGTMVAWSYGIMTAICLISITGFYTIGMPILAWVNPEGARIDLGIQLILFIAVTAYCLVNFSFQCLSVLHRNIHLALSAGMVLAQFGMFILFGHSAMLISLCQLVVMLAFGTIFSLALFHHKHVLAASDHHGHHSIL